MPKIIKSAKGSFTLSSITVDGDGRVVTAESGSAGGVSWQTGAIKTGNFTASADEGYFCNTSGGAFTLTLPSSPSAGNTVAVADYGNDFAGNNLTVARNGSNIEGVASDLTIDQSGAAFEIIFVDATKGWVFVADGNSGNVSDQQFITATGGTITCCGDFKVHTFTSSGTFAVTAGAGPAATLDYLVIGAGGGGGNNRGGGGGAGGYRAGLSGNNGTYTTLPAVTSELGLPVQTGDSIPVTIGAGGAANSNGANTVFSTITSAGGGAGGSPSDPGSTGGSGGGGGHPSRGAGSGNTPAVNPPQGNNGGSGNATSAGSGGGAGQEGNPAPGPGNGGTGAIGATSGINFSDVDRAGGGGGGGQTTGGPASDGGGAGNRGAGTAGTANTGGGGGGGGSQLPGAGAAGGSGLVIIRYKYQ